MTKKDAIKIFEHKQIRKLSSITYNQQDGKFDKTDLIK